MLLHTNLQNYYYVITIYIIHVVHVNYTITHHIYIARSWADIAHIVKPLRDNCLQIKSFAPRPTDRGNAVHTHAKNNNNNHMTSAYRRFERDASTYGVFWGRGLGKHRKIIIDLADN